MDRKQALEQINQNPRDYLTPDGTGKGYVCPICGSGSGPHGTGITSKDNRHFTCWAGRCFTGATVFDILAATLKIDPRDMKKEDYDKVYQYCKLDVGGDGEGRRPSRSLPGGNDSPLDPRKLGGSAYLDACAARAKDTDYYAKRGISPHTVETYHLGYDPAFKTKVGEEYQTWQAAVIPTGGGAYVLRNTNSKTKDDRIRKRGEARLFNQEALETSQTPIFIVEGEFDALSILEVGGQAISLGSVANIDKLLSALRDHPPAAPLILALDNDAPGEKAQSDLIDQLTALAIPFEPYNVSGPHPDPNDALINDRKGLSERVQHAASTCSQAAANRAKIDHQARLDAYQSATSAHAHINAFLSHVGENANTPVTPTGFTRLDETLDGGLYEGLYVLGAISSLGKTTFALQLADQVAAQGRDVLIFSLEMARFELMSKSISRLSYLLTDDKTLPKTSRGITDGKRYYQYTEAEHALLSKSVQAYTQYAQHVYIKEGIGNVSAPDIRAAVETHITLTNQRPVVLVDYLQLLQPTDPRLSDKQNMDRSVMELKRISRDHKIPLIAISSFNRENYKQTANMAAFKESGAIEYSSDVLLALQPLGVGDPDFDVDESKQRDPREVELVILKNRSGKTGGKIPFSYRAMFNLFTEYRTAPARTAKRV